MPDRSGLTESLAMAGQSLKGFPRLVAAWANTLSGLGMAWKHEEAFRLECLLLLPVTPLALLMGQTGVEKALLLGSLLIVIITELLNTAIEATIDRVGLEHHELSKRAKDTGSAAVMVSLALFIIVWILISMH